MKKILSVEGMRLNKQQRSAYKSIQAFVEDRRFNAPKIYRLSGYAGTGKTFLMKLLQKSFSTYRILYTSPTNKATKVLRKTIGKDGECRTIFSLLGIKMVTDEDNKKIQFPKIPSDLSDIDIILIDEAGMINTQLWDYVVQRVARYNTKWILMGDRAQIPPVGEAISPIWLDKSIPTSRLFKVMRHDNEILMLATHVRKQIKKYPEIDLRVKSDHSNKEGVWKMKRNAFIDSIESAAEQGKFTNVDDTKVIAWRNKTVDHYNDIIRRVIYGAKADKEEYFVGERVLIGEPVHNRQGIAIAHIDDEGTVVSCEVSYHSEYKEFNVWRMTVKIDDGPLLVLNVIHKDYVNALKERLNQLALEAKKEPRKWKYFWMLHYAMHKLRYSYCITAHRSQGSTYENVFVDMQDILENSNSKEALQILYVGFTRPKKILVIT